MHFVFGNTEAAVSITENVNPLFTSNNFAVRTCKEFMYVCMLGVTSLNVFTDNITLIHLSLYSLKLHELFVYYFLFGHLIFHLF